MYITLTHYFFNDTATTEIYTLSLHDALPISVEPFVPAAGSSGSPSAELCSTVPENATSLLPAISSSTASGVRSGTSRSEEHTSELQSRQYLVCRLLLEKKDHSLGS